MAVRRHLLSCEFTLWGESRDLWCELCLWVHWWNRPGAFFSQVCDDRSVPVRGPGHPEGVS